MLAGTPSRRELDKTCAAFGVSADDVDPLHPGSDADEGVALWPEHVDAVAIFQRMAGQWRMGAAGPIALDYTALPVVVQALRIKRRAARDAFELIRVMEAEAMDWFSEQK